MTRTKQALALGIPFLAGTALVIAAGAEGLRQGPEDPGAAGIMIWLGAAAAVMFSVIVVRLAVWFVREVIKVQRASGLTPMQMALLEGAAMEGAHLLWAEHNRRVDAELSISVMGQDRTGS